MMLQKLAKLQEVKRLAHPSASRQRMKETCVRIPDRIEEHHGIHWKWCKRLKMNLRRLMLVASTSQAVTDVPKQRTCRSNSGVNIVFKPDCIFGVSENRKRVKVQGSWDEANLNMMVERRYLKWGNQNRIRRWQEASEVKIFCMWSTIP